MLAIKMKRFDPTNEYIWWIIKGPNAAVKAIAENIRHFCWAVNWNIRNKQQHNEPMPQ